MSLVLVIDRRGEQAPWINQVLRRAGHEVILSTELPFGNLAGLLRPAVVLLNLNEDYQTVANPMEAIRRCYPTTAIVVLLGRPSYNVAVDCMRAGAADCLVIPVEGRELVSVVDNAMSRNKVPGGGYRALDTAPLFSDERYKLLAEVSNEGIWALDQNHGTVFINNRMGEMLGYSLDEMMGRPATDFMPAEELVDHRQRITNRVSGQLERYERCFLRKDGSLAYIIISASPLYDRENKFIGSIAICTDISDRKQAENELVAKEAKFRTVIEQLTEGFLLVDEHGTVIEWNSAQERMTGILAAEALGQSYSSIMIRLAPPEQNTPELLENLRRVISRGMNTDGSFFFDRPIDLNIQTANGSLHYLEQTVFPIQTGDGFRVAAITRDVTQNKQFMIALQESEQRYRSVVETSPDAIMIADMSGALLSCNRRTADLLGYAHPEELLGTKVLNLIIPPERRRAMHSLKRILRDGGIRDEEFPVMRKNGEIFITELSGNLVRDAQGKPRFMMGIARDVTARKQTEEELRRLNRALRATSACNQALVRAADEKELLSEVCRTIVLEGGYRFAWVAMCLDGQSIPKPAAWYRPQSSRLAESLCRVENKQTDGPLAQALANLVPVTVENTASASYGEVWQRGLMDVGLRSMAALPLHFEGQPYGALMIYSQESWAFDDQEMTLLDEMAADLSFGIHGLRVRADRRVAWNLLEQSKTDLEAAYDATLEGWSRALELRERETAGHSKRVVQLTVDLANCLGVCQAECLHIRRGALLHDIGKMGIPDSILLKPGPLSSEEWVVMRNHPNYAYQLLHNIPYLQPAMEIPYCHHERWNGSGYPRGLKGEEIPISARIFAVVDVWDALISRRPYRPPWSEQQTLVYIHDQSAISFDPRVVEAFLKLDLSKYSG